MEAAVSRDFVTWIKFRFFRAYTKGLAPPINDSIQSIAVIGLSIIAVSVLALPQAVGLD